MLITQTKTNDIEYSTLYGPGRQVLWTLANTRIGASGSYTVSFRFRAEKGGLPRYCMLYWQEGAPGYHGGNGGVIRLSIVGDDGTGHPNTGDVYGVATFTPNSSPSGSRSIFPQLTFGGTRKALVKGRRYHLYQENIGSNPSQNYISSNNCQVWKEYGSPMRWTDPSDWATLFRQGNGTWQDLSVNGDNLKYWAPIMEIATDEGVFGYTSMEGGSVAVRSNGNSPTLFKQDIPFREVFTPSITGTVVGFSLRVAFPEDDTYLDWAIGSEHGTIWSPYKDYTEVQVGPNKIANGIWRDAVLVNPVSITKGQQLACTFTPRGKAVAVSDVRTGRSYGFSAWVDSVGQTYQGNRWLNWNHNAHAGDGSDGSWPIVLHLA